jgi:hypothetical protein
VGCKPIQCFSPLKKKKKPIEAANVAVRETSSWKTGVAPQKYFTSNLVFVLREASLTQILGSAVTKVYKEWSLGRLLHRGIEECSLVSEYYREESFPDLHRNVDSKTNSQTEATSGYTQVRLPLQAEKPGRLLANFFK